MTERTVAAQRGRDRWPGPRDAYLARDLVRRGVSYAEIEAHLSADRWQRIGRVIVRHAGSPSRAALLRAGVLNCGPRAVLTAFTAAEIWGLKGWRRPGVHVLVPRGAKPNPPAELGVRLYWARDWSSLRLPRGDRLDRVGHALLTAAASLDSSRHACGLIAAGVQQRVVSAAVLAQELDAAAGTRHRRVLRLALADISQGSEALSEIDFAQLCRRYRLPPPERQAVRVDSAGRRRYLDAQWVRADGRRVVAEIDGAVHLQVQSWVADQLRQNEIVLDDSLVLRFPSIVLRTDELAVVRQLARALGLPAPLEMSGSFRVMA